MNTPTPTPDEIALLNRAAKMPTQEELLRMNQRIQKTTAEVLDALQDLLDARDYEALDAKLDAVRTLDAPSASLEAAEIGYYVGLHLGALQKTPMRERSSYRFLLERYQKMVPPGYDVEVILGLKEPPS